MILDQIDDRRRKAIRIGAVALAAIVPVIILVLSLGWTFGWYEPTVKADLTCQACGHQWESPIGDNPACPKCGAAGFAKLSFRCPGCGTVFEGLETVKDGTGAYQFRVPGQKDWKPSYPPALTCPKCRLTSPEILQRGVRKGAGGETAVENPPS